MQIADALSEGVGLSEIGNSLRSPPQIAWHFPSATIWPCTTINTTAFPEYVDRNTNACATFQVEIIILGSMGSFTLKSSASWL